MKLQSLARAEEVQLAGLAVIRAFKEQRWFQGRLQKSVDDQNVRLDPFISR
jgi:hypothetical protein